MKVGQTENTIHNSFLNVSNFANVYKSCAKPEKWRLLLYLIKFLLLHKKQIFPFGDVKKQVKTSRTAKLSPFIFLLINKIHVTKKYTASAWRKNAKVVVGPLSPKIFCYFENLGFHHFTFCCPSFCRQIINREENCWS